MSILTFQGPPVFPLTVKKVKERISRLQLLTPVPSEFLGHQLSKHSPCLSMTVSARLERQNTELCGQIWHVQGCQGTRLSHEGSDRSLHPNESDSLSSYCFCVSVLGPRNVYLPSDRGNQPGQPSRSLPLAVGLQRPFLGRSSSQGVRVLSVLQEVGVSWRVTPFFLSAPLQ